MPAPISSSPLYCWGNGGIRELRKVSHRRILSRPGCLAKEPAKDADATSTNLDEAHKAGMWPYAVEPHYHTVSIPSTSSSGGNSWLQQWRESAEKQTGKLKDWGLAGVVAYGLLNTVYYSLAFIICWVYFANVPKGQGLSAAAAAFLKVFAMVWAGSQVTKLARAAGALLLAPITDKALDGAVAKFPRLKTKQRAFVVFLAACLSVAVAIFSVLVFLWR